MTCHQGRSRAPPSAASLRRVRAHRAPSSELDDEPASGSARLEAAVGLGRLRRREGACDPQRDRPSAACSRNRSSLASSLECRTQTRWSDPPGLAYRPHRSEPATVPDRREGAAAFWIEPSARPSTPSGTARGSARPRRRRAARRRRRRGRGTSCSSASEASAMTRSPSALANCTSSRRNAPAAPVTASVCPAPGQQVERQAGREPVHRQRGRLDVGGAGRARGRPSRPAAPATPQYPPWAPSGTTIAITVADDEVGLDALARPRRPRRPRPSPARRAAGPLPGASARAPLRTKVSVGFTVEA